MTSGAPHDVRSAVDTAVTGRHSDPVARRLGWLERFAQRRFMRHWGISEVPPLYDEDLAREGRYIFVLNDHVTTMEGVVAWLDKTFGLGPEQSVKLMLTIHTHGYGVIGPLPEEQMEHWLYTAQLRAGELGLEHLRFGTELPSEVQGTYVP